MEKNEFAKALKFSFADSAKNCCNNVTFQLIVESCRMLYTHFG